MKVPFIVKVAAVAVVGAVVYLKVLNEEARTTVKESAQDVVNNVQGLANRISGMRPINMDEDATQAQTWAAEQWENIGF